MLQLMALIEIISLTLKIAQDVSTFFFIILATAINDIPMPEIASYRGSWGERSCPRGSTALQSVSVNCTLNLPIERRTLRLSYRHPSEIFFANTWVSGDVMMCRWGVTEKPTIGDKRLSWLWQFTVISCKTFLSDFDRKGNIKREQPPP